MKHAKPSQLNLVSWLLRLGLAAVFLYAAISSLQHPAEWVGYLPSFLIKMIAATTLVKLIAVYEILLSVWLLSGKYARYAAGLSALTLFGILIVNLGQLIITFRDIGLVFMALALAVLED